MSEVQALSVIDAKTLLAMEVEPQSFFAIEVGSISGNLVAQLERFLRDYHDTGLIAIDIPQRVRDMAGNKGVYTIETELTAKGANQRGIVDFLTLIRGYEGITELTVAIVNALIDKITVSERYKDKNGEAKQCIKIYHKFVGNLHDVHSRTQVNLPLGQKSLHSLRQYVRRYGGHRLIPKPCECCGAAFSPQSHNSRFCLNCPQSLSNRCRSPCGSID